MEVFFSKARTSKLYQVLKLKGMYSGTDDRAANRPIQMATTGTSRGKEVEQTKLEQRMAEEQGQAIRFALKWSKVKIQANIGCRYRPQSLIRPSTKLACKRIWGVTKK